MFHVLGIVIAACVLSVSRTAIAQDNDTNDILFWYADGNLQSYNLGSGEYGERLSATFFSLETSPASGVLFGLQAPSAFGFVPGEAEIVRLDFNSRAMTSIYARNNILGFAVLPDSQRMVVLFLPAEIQSASEYRSFNPNLLCLLSITDDQCRDIELPEDQYGIVWVTTDRFLVHGQLDDKWFSVDAQTLTPVPFSIEVSVSSTLDFGSPVEFFAVQAGEAAFGYVNTTTGEFRPYDFAIHWPYPTASVTNLMFSPSGQYLLFKNGNSHFVLEMASGSIVSELEDFQNPQWLSDGQIIARHFPETGVLPQELVLFELGSNTIESIGSFEEEVFVIVP